MPEFGVSAEDLVNRALDGIGYVGTPVGDLQEGGTVANACLRIYHPTRGQLLRGALWNFARIIQPLTLLQDATGQATQQQIAAGLPVTVGTGTPGMYGWTFEYGLPVNCVQARWSPVNCLTAGAIPLGNITGPSAPPTSVFNIQPVPQRNTPSRFLVSTDFIPTLVGTITDWSQYPDYSTTYGQAPNQQTVILSNQPNALLCYTMDVVQPSLWDPLFAQAFVAMLASQLCMSVLPDKKFAVQMRRDQIAIAKSALEIARVRDGDELSAETTDHIPDWIRTRQTAGNGWGGWGAFGAGVLGYGWCGVGFCDGSVF